MARSKRQKRPTYKQRIEIAEQKIAQVQRLVDIQDKKFDRKCVMGGNDYGDVLIEEIELLAQEIHAVYGDKPSKKKAEAFEELTRVLNMISWSFGGSRGLKEFQAVANKDLAQKFHLYFSQVKSLRVRASEIFRSKRKDLTEKIKLFDKKKKRPKEVNKRYKSYLEVLFSDEEIDALQPQMKKLLSYFIGVFPRGKMKTKFKEIMSPWKEFFTQDPDFVLDLFEFATDPRYRSNISAEDFSDTLKALYGAFEKWKDEYKEDREFVKKILTARLFFYEKIFLYDRIFKPNRAKILPYKQEFLTILTSLNLITVLKFLEKKFFVKGGIYEKYFKHDPEGVAKMIEIAKDPEIVEAIFTFGLPLFKDEYEKNGFSENVEKYWRFFSKRMRQFMFRFRRKSLTAFSEKTLLLENEEQQKRLSMYFNDIFPDLKRNPDLLLKIGRFTEGWSQKGINHGINQAYWMSRKDAFEQPEDFARLIKFLRDKAPNSFVKKFEAMWLTFREEFKKNGFTPEMERLFGIINKINLKTAEVFSLFKPCILAHPEQFATLVDDFGNLLYFYKVDSYVSVFFTPLKDDFVASGYTDKMKKYLKDIEALYSSLPKGDLKYHARDLMREVVFRDMAPDIYKNGLQKKHKELAAFFKRDALPKLRKAEEDTLRKIVIYLKDSRIENDLKAAIKSAEPNQLLSTVAKFEKDFEKKHDWFGKEYGVGEFVHRLSYKKIKPGDFPMSKKFMKTAFATLNIITRLYTGEIIRKNVPKSSGDRLFTIPQHFFDQVYFSAPFQKTLKKAVGGMTYMNSFSLAHVTYRFLLKRQMPINDKNIEKALKKVFGHREKIKDYVIIGPDTKFILFTHEEYATDNNLIIQNIFKAAGGKEKNILANVKGLKIENGENLNKKAILDAIRSAKTGEITLMFDGHGSPENWAFSANNPDDMNRSVLGDPRTINYRELGDALIESGNIRNFNLVSFTCRSYSYFQNLFNYLEQIKGFKAKPKFAFSAGNKERSSYGKKVPGEITSYFLDIIAHFIKKGLIKKDQPVKIKDLWMVEGLVYRAEDAAFFVEGDDGEALEVGGEFDLEDLSQAQLAFVSRGPQ